MKTEHSQLFQQFRSTVDGKITTIEAQHDDATGTDFVLWQHVQRSFPNVRIVRDGNTDIQFMMDSKFEDLTPLRIEYYPGVVLDVVMKEVYSSTSPFPVYTSHDGDGYIRYGSMVLLQHSRSGSYLSTSSSHYQMGSGQRVVFCSQAVERGQEEWWQVLGHDRDGEHGRKIPYGSRIRLFNVVHRHWLCCNSQNNSPSSCLKEVSGSGGQDSSDSRAEWTVKLVSGAASYWQVRSIVSIYHENSANYICSYETRFGKDIEVGCGSGTGEYIRWKAYLD
ncbi:hypothetical protein BGZ80_003998 [Entomortierella chlamydospora]|uniref:MIR domain-containing protein n=1 Tax=Entomortierella chlamydospora TaxID=101097 RepID=A0A9P6MN09_9FUNG|nr:hypothetical protein BGZ79_004090 [Entomortierella chlamydospora]KAG0007978.1 hypothetical protein BGZ80_003998 [Entomortierella chlamydospora]